MKISVEIGSITEDDYRELLSALGSGSAGVLLCRIVDLAGLYISELEKGAAIVCGNSVFYRQFGIGRIAEVPPAQSPGHRHEFELSELPWHWKLKRLHGRAMKLGMPRDRDAFINMLLSWGHLSFIAVAFLGAGIAALRPGKSAPRAIRYKHLEALRLQYLPRS